MIRIQKSNIQKAVSMWTAQIHIHLNEVHTGHHKLRYKDTGGSHHTFSTRIEKYKAMYDDRCRTIATMSAEAKDFFWRRIEGFLDNDEYLTGNKTLCDKWSRWQSLYLRNTDLKDIVKDIFISIYEDVSEAIGYDILKKLDVRTCPYCNRYYTFTLKTKKNEFKTRPEFDHFLDKSTFPMLAVTFFNLVPSCKECNHGKGTKEVGVNPYFSDFKSKFILMTAPKEPHISPKKMNLNDIRKISNEDDFNVDFKLPTDRFVKAAEEKNIKSLGLRQLYNMHKDYVMEMVEKAVAYNRLTRFGIVDSFQGVFHSENDVYNLIFGRYLSDSEQLNRPLSKLTADVLDQLQIRPEPPVS